jgi:hypothetical protein
MSSQSAMSKSPPRAVCPCNPRVGYAAEMRLPARSSTHRRGGCVPPAPSCPVPRPTHSFPLAECRWRAEWHRTGTLRRARPAAIHLRRWRPRPIRLMTYVSLAAWRAICAPRGATVDTEASVRRPGRLPSDPRRQPRRRRAPPVSSSKPAERKPRPSKGMPAAVACLFSRFADLGLAWARIRQVRESGRLNLVCQFCVHGGVAISYFRRSESPFGLQTEVAVASRLVRRRQRNPLGWGRIYDRSGA